MISSLNTLIYNKQAWVVETSPLMLCDAIARCLMLSDITTVNFIEHHFQPQGYTAVWLLAESHVALHTFPEHGASHIAIACCNQSKFNMFVKLILEELHEINLHE